VHLEIRRRGDDVVWRPLDVATFAFRRALADGAPLEQAAGAALDVDPGFDLAAGLGDLLQEDAIVGWTVSPATTSSLLTTSSSITKETHP
jgi:hypothetical protein